MYSVFHLLFHSFCPQPLGIMTKGTSMLRSSQVNQEMTQVIQGQSNVIQRRGYVIQQKSYVNKEHMNLLRIHSTCQVDQSQELGPRNSIKIYLCQFKTKQTESYKRNSFEKSLRLCKTRLSPMWNGARKRMR